jgi:hypothetical protein
MLARTAKRQPARRQTALGAAWNAVVIVVAFTTPPH